jgi:hypothetical protein
MSLNYERYPPVPLSPKTSWLVVKSLAEVPATDADYEVHTPRLLEVLSESPSGSVDSDRENDETVEESTVSDMDPRLRRRACARSETEYALNFGGIKTEVHQLTSKLFDSISIRQDGDPRERRSSEIEAFPPLSFLVSMTVSCLTRARNIAASAFHRGGLEDLPRRSQGCFFER